MGRCFTGPLIYGYAISFAGMSELGYTTAHLEFSPLGESIERYM